MAGLVLLMSGCGNSAEVRYKVIVDVNDNGTQRSGSSVMSWTLSEPTVALASPYDGEFKGEAVDVDLGGGRHLFALLHGEDNNEGVVQLWPEQLFDDPDANPNDRVGNIRKISAKVGAERVLSRWEPPLSDSGKPFNRYPMLVTFGVPGDPTSLKAVEPDALHRSFGPGVALNAIKVQITDEPVTTGIKSRLPWLEPVGKLRSTLIPNPPRLLKDAAPVQLVSSSAFSTELFK